MTRLAQIIDGATGEDVSVASLLRQVKVVAARLGTVTLEDWVDRELSGYGGGDKLPDYRGPWPVEVSGHFVGPGRSEMTNYPIPAVAIPKEYRETLYQLTFLQPVSELEELMGAHKNLQNNWPADAVAFLNHLCQTGKLTLIPMHSLVSAKRTISPAQVRAVVDAVRTRILGLALDLEKIAPAAGEPGAPSVDMSKVRYVVTNNIYGNSNNLALSSPGAQQSTSVVAAGDLGALLRAVKEAGLGDDEAVELRDAIREDEADPDHESGRPGPRVKDFMGRLALGTMRFAGDAGSSAAGGVVGTLVGSYFGMSV